MSPRAPPRVRRISGCSAVGSGSLEDVTRNRRIARRTTSTSLSWCNTRRALGVGYLCACSESAAARALPQKQVTLEAAWGRVGSPRRLRSAARNSESERVMLRAAWSASSHAEVQRLAMLWSRACAICTTAVLPSRPRRKWSKAAGAWWTAHVLGAAAAALVSRAARRQATSSDERPGAAARWFQVRCVGGHQRAAARSFGWLCDASTDTP
jgi:hypothetical protein